jgi:phosphatidylcholine synthase
VAEPAIEPDARTLSEAEISPAKRPTPSQTIAAYAVHVFTATGVICALLAADEVASPSPRPKLVFVYLAIQVLIDALDGPMARAVHIKVRAPRIDGRTIDDIVDYLTYTFIPLLLVWRMGWVPGTGAAGGWWVAPAMVASLFGFANTAAKDEQGGFFLGFPSYWNIIAFYVGIWHAMAGPWPGAVVIILLALLTVLPVRFIYPNLAPRPWKMPTMIGALVWLVLLAWMWKDYPTPPAWLMWISLIYPAFYIALSAWLDIRARQISATTGRSSA